MERRNRAAFEWPLIMQLVIAQESIAGSHWVHVNPGGVGGNRRKRERERERKGGIKRWELMEGGEEGIVKRRKKRRVVYSGTMRRKYEVLYRYLSYNQ